MSGICIYLTAKEGLPIPFLPPPPLTSCSLGWSPSGKEERQECFQTTPQKKGSREPACWFSQPPARGVLSEGISAHLAQGPGPHTWPLYLETAQSKRVDLTLGSFMVHKEPSDIDEPLSEVFRLPIWFTLTSTQILEWVWAVSFKRSLWVKLDKNQEGIT